MAMARQKLILTTIKAKLTVLENGAHRSKDRPVPVCECDVIALLQAPCYSIRAVSLLALLQLVEEPEITRHNYRHIRCRWIFVLEVESET